MVQPSPLLQNPEFMADVENDTKENSGQAVADRWGTSKSVILKYRQRLRDGEPLTQVTYTREAPKIATAVVVPPDVPGYRLEDDGTTVVIQTRPTVIEQTVADVHQAFVDEGLDPTDFDISFKRAKWENGALEVDGTMRVLHYCSISARRLTAKDKGAPAWPVIQPAEPVTIAPQPAWVAPIRRDPAYKLAMKCADHQIGFRVLDDGSFETFHDPRAMALFVEVCRLYQPDKIQVLGDFLDLPSQSRWAQEAGFARTTQMSLNTAYAWLAALREACPDADIIIIEGNHDKRMQVFIETNALAAFGLRRAGMPKEWPVMSLPNLLRLEELGIRYVDAYPAATDWDNDTTRNIHGTKAKSNGSTTAQYVLETPHLSTWAGHTHRAEVTYHTHIGPRGEAIESYSANPGCMCRTDGTVPSVHGAIGADGASARIVENWQAGFGMLYYTETESWPFVHRIRDGRTLIDNRLITVD